jgi:hypothetical protein
MKHEPLVEIYNILQTQWYVLSRNAMQHNGPVFSATVHRYERPNPNPGQYEAGCAE